MVDPAAPVPAAPVPAAPVPAAPVPAALIPAAPPVGESPSTTGRESPADIALEDSRRRPSLSPSRAADFKSCPLLYRLRSI
ncbi:MAG TPA: hypothetical protein VKB59_03265, partial [Micromonosporaceae bacterium]|nr:hypothetical protein [Micromonosporaceae bacterium]